MEYEDLLELAKARRSIRRFLPDPLPEGMVEKIIDVARYAPSGFNMQPWEFVVLKEPELKGRIVEMVKSYRASHFPVMEPARESWQKPPWRPYHNEKMDWSQAPVFIILFGDERVKAALPMTVRYNPSKMESIFNTSLANAFSYMLLAAASFGLGQKHITAVQVPAIHCQIKQMLNLPECFRIFDLLVLGRPAAEARDKYLRPTEKMIHYGPCTEDEIRSDEEVRDFICRTRSWAMATVRRGPDEEEG